MSANTQDKNNKKRSAILDMVFTAMFTAVIAVCSIISIPVGEVPITLQTFAVCISAALLGWKRGTLSVLIYILLGAVGVPVFGGMTGGLGVLAGPTGGYIIGFLPAAVIIGLAAERYERKALVERCVYPGDNKQEHEEKHEVYMINLNKSTCNLFCKFHALFSIFDTVKCIFCQL